MGVKFKNNAVSTIADIGGIDADDLELNVASGDGDTYFPAAGGDDYFYCTLVDSAGNREIIKVTARSGDAFTFLRAQEGTTARVFASGSVVSMRLTAVLLEDIANNALDSKVAAFAGLTGAANKLPYFTGASAMDVADLSVFVRTILDDADASTVLTTLGITAFAKTILDDVDEATFKETVNLEPGVDVQAYHALLTAIAALTPTDGHKIVGNGSTWTTEAKETLKCMAVFINDGGDADSIRIYTTSLYNSGSFDVVASLSKSETSGEFTLNAVGSIVTISDATYIAGLSAVLSVTPIRNSTLVDILISPSISGDDILFTFTDATTGASIDLTAAFEGVGKVLHFTFLYV